MSKPDHMPAQQPAARSDAQQSIQPLPEFASSSSQPGSWPAPRYSDQTRSGMRAAAPSALSAEHSGMRLRTRTALHTALPVGERILLLGSTGQVGGELARILAPLAEVVLPTRAELDLTDEDSLRLAIRRIRPRWILNAAAYTAVDRAETDAAKAYTINTHAVRILGEEAVALSAAVIHLSTDYVFDGTKTSPYCESDPPNPKSVYGASKLAGEQALAASGATHIILRTSWVFGASGHNFLRTIVKLAGERKRLSIVGDQHGAPTWSRDLARLMVHIVIRSEILAATSDGTLASGVGSKGGVYHASGAGATTWFEFASTALDLQSELDPHAELALVDSISTADYPTAAQRPANSRLDCTRLTSAFDWQMMPWQDALAAVLPDLLADIYPEPA